MLGREPSVRRTEAGMGVRLAAARGWPLAGSPRGRQGRGGGRARRRGQVRALGRSFAKGRGVSQAPGGNQPVSLVTLLSLVW